MSAIVHISSQRYVFIAVRRRHVVVQFSLQITADAPAFIYGTLRLFDDREEVTFPFTTVVKNNTPSHDVVRLLIFLLCLPYELTKIMQI